MLHARVGVVDDAFVPSAKVGGVILQGCGIGAGETVCVLAVELGGSFKTVFDWSFMDCYIISQSLSKIKSIITMYGKF